MSLPIQRLIDLHRRQLLGITEIRGVRNFGRIYQDSRGELEAKLARLKRAGKGSTFEAHHLRQVLVQVMAAVHDVETGIDSHLNEVGPMAVKLAPRHVVDAVEKLGPHFGAATPIIQSQQAAVFMGGVPKVPKALLDKYKSSSRLYGKPVVGKIRSALTKSVLQGESIDQAIDRVAATDGIFAQAEWRAARIVRTELAYSYGVGKQVGLETLKRDVPRVMKRLVATFDDRTGKDSEELNGQIVPVDQPFVWHVKDAHGRSTGKTIYYMQPPNRPNDREITVPWMSDWPQGSLREAGPVSPQV